MKPTTYPRVKICCISSIEEAQLAVAYGASALGLVSAMPSGPGVIAEDAIASIAASIPPAVSSVLLTSAQDPEVIIAQQRYCEVNTLQICDRLEKDSYRILRRALPGIALIQVIHVAGEESISEALAIAPFVNALLLDSGNQSLAIKELGGTARVHDWHISVKIRELVDVPLFLAGGLKVENVQVAVNQVHPYALDVCSGVRTDGKLDEEKLRTFFKQLSGIAR